MKPTKVSVVLDSLAVYDLDGPIDKLCDHLQDVRKRFEAKGFSDIRIDAVQEYESVSIEIHGDRPETEEEKARRLKALRTLKKKNKDQREKTRQAELKELARLKKKYGDE